MDGTHVLGVRSSLSCVTTALCTKGELPNQVLVPGYPHQRLNSDLLQHTTVGTEGGATTGLNMIRIHAD